MVLIDTSAWIEFLRDTGSRACRSVDRVLADETGVVTDPIYLELLSGARPNEVDPLLRLLGEQDYQSVAPRLDWLDAASIFRACRRSGVSIRSQLDCLIAAVAIRVDVPVLHHDRDFDQIAERTALRVA